jgi:hypothetical protein
VFTHFSTHLSGLVPRPAARRSAQFTHNSSPPREFFTGTCFATRMNDQRTHRVHTPFADHAAGNLSTAEEPIDSAAFVPKWRKPVVGVICALGALLLLGTVGIAMLASIVWVANEDFSTVNAEGY